MLALRGWVWMATMLITDLVGTRFFQDWEPGRSVFYLCCLSVCLGASLLMTLSMKISRDPQACPCHCSGDLSLSLWHSENDTSCGGDSVWVCSAYHPPQAATVCTVISQSWHCRSLVSEKAVQFCLHDSSSHDDWLLYFLGIVHDLYTGANQFLIIYISIALPMDNSHPC